MKKASFSLKDNEIPTRESEKGEIPVVSVSKQKNS
jgi:hypothetical protein